MSAPAFLVVCHNTRELALGERVGWTIDLAKAGRYTADRAERAAETMLDGQRSSTGVIPEPIGDWDTPTEPVLGEQLAPGDIVRNHGYRWLLVDIVHDPMRGVLQEGQQGRYVAYAKAIDAPDLPSGYRNGMSLGLRVDLHWTREIRPC